MMKFISYNMLRQLPFARIETLSLKKVLEKGHVQSTKGGHEQKKLLRSLSIPKEIFPLLLENRESGT
jgi:hypothetical protein